MSRDKDHLESVIAHLPEHLAAEVRWDTNQMFVHDSEAERFYYVEWGDKENFRVDGLPVLLSGFTGYTGGVLGTIVLSIRNQIFPWEMD